MPSSFLLTAYNKSDADTKAAHERSGEDAYKEGER